jgi:hypothetical protein
VDPAEAIAQNVVEQVTSAALSNDIEGEQFGRENPQPPTWADHPPAGLIAMKDRGLAQFCQEGVIRMVILELRSTAVWTATECASRILAVPLLEQRGGDLHPQSRSLKS